MKRSCKSMISHQQKNGKQRETVKSDGIETNGPAKKKNGIEGQAMTVDSELDKFSGDKSLPEKHKEDEVRLANSILPRSLPSFK
ncbi:hypothetical protein [Mucilaginibacter sp.]|uniref:hypothetical protein n=1 Tax=Mucilaginibacter sp. TaxID=1882438 RepID=UPI002852A9F4|nr:hypothetical protein [Mucilaginibacter sp.]